MGEGKTRGGTSEVPSVPKKKPPLLVVPTVSFCAPSPRAGCTGLSPPPSAGGTEPIFSPGRGRKDGVDP